MFTVKVKMKSSNVTLQTYNMFNVACVRRYQYQTRLTLSVADILCACPWKVTGREQQRHFPEEAVPLTALSLSPEPEQARNCNGIMIM